MSSDIELSLNSLKERPSDSQILKSLGDALASRGQLGADVVELLDRSRAFHSESGDWRLVLGLIDLELPATDDVDRRADLLALKGRVLEEELLEETEALEVFREVLELRPDDQETRDTLDQIGAERENWQRIADKYVDEAEAAPDRELTAELYLSAAVLVWRNEAESPRIEELLRRSLDVDPRNRKASLHLERLLRKQERFRELADLLDERVAVAASPEEQQVALLAAGELWGGRLDSPEKAAEALRRVLTIDPASTRALTQLVDLYTDQEDWSNLVKVYEDALRAQSRRDVEVGNLLQIGMLYAHKLDQWEPAEEHFRRVRKADPLQPVMLSFYRDYYRRREEPTKILALLDSAQRMTKDRDRRAEIAIEMAEVAEQEVGNLEKAIDIWKGVQRMDRAREGTERQLKAAAALKRLYRQTDPPKWNALRELLKDEIDALPAERVEDKIALLMEVVAIYRDHLSLDVMVINTYNAILALQPDHGDALDALTAKYEALGRWNELISILQRRTDAIEDAAERVATLHRVADLWIDKFGNQSQAIKPLETILEVEPGEPRALERLREIFSKRRNWRGLLELLTRDAQHREGEQRRALYREMAQIAAERMGDPAEGIQVWNRVLAEDPQDGEALEQLTKLYHKESRWPALAEVLHRRLAVEGVERDDEAPRLLELLGEIYTNRLRAVDNAIEVWRELLSLSADHPKALVVLRELYVQQRRWEDLEALLGGRGQWEELAETMITAADRSGDIELKIRLYRRVGEICRDQLDNPERAIKAYERVLAVDPQNAAVALALVPLYRGVERWGRLLAVYETLLAHAGRREQQLRLLAEIRIIHERYLGSKQLAFQWCARAFVLDPEDPDLKGEFERLAAEVDAWEELVEVYRERAAALEDSETKRGLLRQLAELCRDRLHRPEDAEGFYRELLGLQPEDWDTLAALERIYAATQRWPELIQILGRQAVLTAETPDKVELLFKIAFLQEERVGQPDAAIDAFRAVVGLEPDNPRALKALERLFSARGEWSNLEGVLQQQLEHAEDKDVRVGLLFKLGEVYGEELRDEQRAIGAYAQVLELEPGHKSTVLALEPSLEGDHRGEVAGLLKPVYERTDDWPRLRQVLEILLQYETDPQVRLLLYKRLVPICHRRLGDADGAFIAAIEVLLLDGTDGENRRELSALADEVGRVAEMVEALRGVYEQLEPGSDVRLEQALAKELAQAFDERLGAPETAEPFLRRLIELDSGNYDAFATLERILRDTGNWLELRRLLEQWHDATHDLEQRKNLLLQVCLLNEDVLGEVEQAISSYERILALDPEDGQALRALERHYRDTERWEELSGLLSRQVDFAADEVARAEVKIKLAEVRADSLDDAAGAIDLLEEVVAADPSLIPAVSLLERLQGEEQHKGRVAMILEAVYERVGSWEKLRDTLMLRRALSDDRMEEVQLLTRAAELCEARLEQPGLALDTYLDALALAPGSEALHQQVERLAAELEAWDQLASGWRTAVEATAEDDITLQALLLTKLSAVERERLERADLARVTYERLLQLDPESSEIAGPAAVALSEIYEQGGLFGQLIDVLKRRVGWSDDGDERQHLLLRIAVVQEDLGQADQAVESYAALLGENDRSADALDALERLHLGAERWPELIAIFRRRVELADDVEQRRALLTRVAEIYEHELEDREEAITTYLGMLDESPDDLETLRQLARLYRLAERWPDLLEMIERQLPLVEEEQRTELTFEAASLQHRSLLDVGPAVDRYREVLEHHGQAGHGHGHQGAREALEELLEEPEFGGRVAGILAEHYQRQEQWSELIRIRDLQAGRAEGSQRAALLRQVAELAEEGLEDPARAFEAYREAVDPGDPELRQLLGNLTRLAGILDRRAELADVLTGVVPDVMDADLQRELHLHIASLCREDLEDPERARRHYLQVLDGDAENEEALGALEQLYEEQQQWDELLEILHRRADLATADRAARFLIQAAAICRDRLERAEDAIADFERVLGLAAEEPLIDRDLAHAAAESLDRLYEATERWSDLDTLLMREADQLDDPQARSEVHFRLGRLRSDKLGDNFRALEAYREVLRSQPDHAESVAAMEAFLDEPELSAEAATVLEPLYTGRQDWPRLIRIYQIRLEAAEDREGRLALRTRIAQLYEEQLEDLDQAFRWYGEVYGEKPDDRSIREQLLRLAGILERWQPLAEVFAAALDLCSTEQQEGRELALILGGIYDDRLFKWEPAKECYDRILENDREDAEVFTRLERLLMRYERWDELLSLYQDFADAAVDPDQRRDLMLKICRVWEEALYNLPEAIDAYRAMLDMDDRDAEVVLALDRLYTETERWSDLCELLERQLGYLEEAEAVEQRHRLGMICELQLEDSPRAIDYYEEVLNQDAGHRDALERLEGLVLDREQRYRIARILEPIYQAEDEWAKLVVIYDAQLEFIDDVARRVELLKEIARLHEERGGSIELAFRALCRAYEAEYGDQELLDGIERLAARLNNWPDVISVLRAGTEKVYDQDLLASLHGKIAQIQEQRLGDREAAIVAWREVLAAREADGDAVAALLRMLTALGRYEELVDVLRLKAEHEPDPEIQRAAYRQMAEVNEVQLDRLDEAIDAWRQVLAIEDGDAEGLDALERLLQTTEQWMELIGTKRRKIEVGSDFEVRLELQLQVAEIYVARVDDSFEAIAAYKTALDWDEDNERALDALDGLYMKEGMWSDLLEIVELKAIHEQDQAASTALLFRAGEILAKEIGDLDAAVDRFEQVLRADAQHEGARAALDEILSHEAHRERVAGILEELYQASGEVDSLIRVLSARLEGIADPAMTREIWVRIGRLQEEGRDDPRQAYEAYVKAFDAEPADEDVRAVLDRLAAQLSVHGELVEAYLARLDDVYDNELARTLHLKAAQMLEESLGNDDRAEGEYRAALDCGGDEHEPLQALDRVLTRLERHGDLLEVLERLVEVVPEPDGQAELYCRIGQLRSAHREDLDGAFGAHCSALERQPAHQASRESMHALLDSEIHRVQVLDVLEPICEEGGEHDKLVELLEVRLGTLVDPQDRVGLLTRIAELQEQRLDSRDQALGAYGRAMAEDPGNEQVLAEVERLAEELGRWTELVALAEEVLADERTDGEAATELGLKTAEWYSDKLGNLDKSEEVFKKVLEGAPGAPKALAALERLYRASGRDSDLADVLWQQADAEYDGDRKRQLLAEIARLCESSDPAAAIKAWRAVLDVDASDLAAIDGLIDLLRQTEQWQELLEAYEQKMSLVSGTEERVEIKRRVVAVYSEQIEDEDRVIEAYRDILDLDPVNGEALEALEGLYRGREEWTSVLEVLQQQADLQQGSEALPIYFRLAALCRQQLDDLDQASGFFQQIISMDPGNAEALEQLEAMLREAEQWHDLIDVLRNAADWHESQEDRQGAIRRLLAVARLWTEQLDNPEAAAEVLEAVLEQDEAHVGAITELARIHEASKNWAAASECLERAAGLDPEPAEAAELSFRLGRIAAEQGAELSDVSAHYEQALQLAPGHREAAEALLELAREQESWDRVAQLLEDRASAATEDEERFGVLCELGRIYGDKLEEADRSVSAFERAHELKADEPEVLAPLAEAYYAAERFDEVTPILESLIARAGTRRTKELASYHFRLGTIAEQRGDSEAAVKHYDKAYRCDSTHAPTLVCLGKLHFAQEKWEEARRVFRSMLLQNIEGKADITRADIFWYLGRIHSALGEGAKAKSMYQRGLEADADHEGLKSALAELG